MIRKILKLSFRQLESSKDGKRVADRTIFRFPVRIMIKLIIRNYRRVLNEMLYI